MIVEKYNWGLMYKYTLVQDLSDYIILNLLNIIRINTWTLMYIYINVYINRCSISMYIYTLIPSEKIPSKFSGSK